MRIKILQTIIWVGLGVLGAALFREQVMQGSYYRELGEKNRVRLIPLEAPRGRVLDRAGRVLAGNRASYDIMAIPEDMEPEVYFRLSQVLAMPEDELRNRIHRHREFPFAPALVQADVGRAMAFRIEEMKPELPGVFIKVTGLRYYPYREIASHLIGYIGKISRPEYETADRKRFGMNSWIGRSGIEKSMDDRLRGWRGGRQIEVDARGRLIRVLSEEEPEPGEDIHLTIDLEFQKRISDLLQGKNASVAVLDLEKEGFLALASQPSYDPNIFVAPGASADRMKVLNDTNHPMLDRGTACAYPPGSVFKLVTAITALELGKITPHTQFKCGPTFQLRPGTHVFHDWLKTGHGTIDLYQAIERSSNVYFYNLSKLLSADDIARYARILGFGAPMDLELSHVTPGLVPDRAWKKKKFGQEWFPGDTVSYVIGQSYLLTSPLQILRLAAIIAKNGLFVQPTLVGSSASSTRQAKKVAVSEKTLETIRKAMLRVVESDYGTGQLARVDFDKMAAKTGTAQVPPKTAHSWMTGFFPYHDPEIAFVAFVEHGGSGGVTAGKIVKEMVKIYREIYETPLVA
ncbi:MAG: penicillin-binding protein 2 [Candidatus Omnitrophota bacterium]